MGCLLASGTAVTAVPALGKEDISHPSSIASDLPLALPTFFLKLAQHVHFRKADSQIRRAKQTSPCLRLSEEDIPFPLCLLFPDTVRVPRAVKTSLSTVKQCLARAVD